MYAIRSYYALCPMIPLISASNRNSIELWFPRRVEGNIQARFSGMILFRWLLVLLVATPSRLQASTMSLNKDRIFQMSLEIGCHAFHPPKARTKHQTPATT